MLNQIFLNKFAILTPEILLVSVVLFMQIIAVYYKNQAEKISLFTILLALIVAAYIKIWSTQGAHGSYTNMFEISYAWTLAKIIVLIFAIMSISIYRSHCMITNTEIKQEFLSLSLLSVVGIFISISARDFMLLFCGLELQAISGYALAAFNSEQYKSSESGLKYFVLGALMSCVFLLGTSFLYGFSGSIQFNEVHTSFDETLNIGLIVGSVLVVISILFKLSAAPFHFWTPDVYEGAPISAVSYFSAAQKFGALIVLANIIFFIIGQYTAISVTLLKTASILSMVIGALGAIGQHSLKRLMAYSSVLNIGYVMLAMSLNNTDALYAAILYMFIYGLSVIGFFSCIVALLGEKADNATFDDLYSASKERKTLASAISIIMFSMIGIPPLAGFFGKYMVFYKAIETGEIMLAIIGVVSSVISAFYYLKIVKYMYFVESDNKITIIPTNLPLLIVSGTTVAFLLFFFIFLPFDILG